ncbi:GNAT family N-acetyltransferase [Streptacidiphilus cavernicola]|uniref:GNAT family N-acetyltransferase n=1 Tax=Streptacidiphilus cavernicola TaxID=3342716 RepID=A0ABV6W0K1_9ACTN
MEPVNLQTDRLTLRALGEEDIPAVHLACQDEQLQRYVPVPSPYLYEHAESFVREASPAGWREETMLNLGAFTRDGGDLVSSVGIALRQPRAEAVAEVGYWTAKQHRGNGYTTEAVIALCRWGFAELGLQRIEWLAITGNDSSWAVAERAGFTLEGTLRSRLLHRGERQDAWIGSLLPTDLELELDGSGGR